ncbi:hypothetical protein [Sphaerisporangium siamense]|uniref:Uncharacterized protein n=1 Tax=Sphaerisporangium siamense TaxID=795645 RepID=A0A7W7D9P7_9ACTN|nr:hypothetical protein [Sphaerisporangium siamense]MBB4702586.1 hypothetical protein [Sphaerisporangium siamense]
MITREIIDAYAMVHPDGVERWTIVTRQPDGTLWPYLLPSETFENLAVMYGLDPDDIDELLRVAMLELHIAEPRLPGNFAADPAAAAGHVRDGRPVVVETAETTEQAREAHLARVAWVEENEVRIVTPKPGRRRMLRALDIDSEADVEVDAHERLAQLKATYQADHDRMRDKRQMLSRAIGRQV